MASASSISKKLNCDIMDVVDVLFELGYIQKDETKERMYVISEEGYKHGKYITLSKPSWDKETEELIRDHLVVRGNIHGKGKQ